MTHVRGTPEEIRIAIFKPFGVNKINKLVLLTD